jgi:hypothetical protein
VLKSTGLVLAAGGLATANEVIFVPLEQGKPASVQNFNWRIVPATVVLAFVLGGLEKVSEPLGVGLAGLILLGALIIPVGNAPTPIDNAAKIFGKTGKVLK